jgi:hypothetical protein
MTASHTPTAGPHGVPHAHSTSNRAGHAVAVGVNLLVLYLVNVSPGWEAVPFLTGSTTLVLPFVNASLWVSVVAEALYVVWTADWLRALGDTVTTGVGLAAIVRLWEVFPFDVSAGWEVALRVLLGIAVVGSLIGMVAALSRLIRSRARTDRAT